MVEELPSGVFLLFLKITTMSKQIYIVTRREQHAKHGINYAMNEHTKVVGAWERRTSVYDFFKRRIKHFVKKGYTYDHINEYNSVGLLERYIFKDSKRGEIVSYTVTLDDLL